MQVLAIALAFLEVTAMSGAAEHVLAENGQTDYVIVTGAGATGPERTAARELAVHLEAITGAYFDVVECGPGESPAAACLYVGSGARFQQAVPDAGELEADGIRIVSRGDSIYFGGEGPRGALYAVYHFLEEELGCRWWTPSESTIPSKPRLAVPPQDVAYAPPIRVREAFYYHAFDPVWAARNRLNGHSQQIPEAYGGHHRILGWCHTFFQILPPGEYFSAHPEWYSLVDGRRVDDGQLCLTNEAMREEFIRNTLEWVRADPGAGIISISQNDWRDPCECSRCSALAGDEGSQSGPIIHFVNAVAEAVEAEFPDFLVMTLAYSYTRQAPEHVRPRDNVAIRLCSIECDFSEPLATGAQNRDFLRDIQEWSRIAPHLYIWNYVTNFSQFLLPHPNWDGLAPDLRLFADHKAIGVFEQGDRRSTCGDFYALRPWLLAKLLWDPSQDADALIGEFLEGYYGPAAPFLRSYIDITREAVARADVPLRSFMRTTREWLTLDDLNRITDLFNEAARRVEGDRVLEERLVTARMPVDYLWVRRYAEFARQAEREGAPFRGPGDPVAARDAFLRKIRILDCEEYGERHLFEHAAPGLSRLFEGGGPVPAALRERDAGGYVFRPARSLQVMGNKKSAALVPDAASCGGHALRIPAHVTGRNVRCPIDPEIQGLGRAETFMRVRVDAWADAGPACAIGVYDLRDGREMRRRVVNIEELTGGEYVSIKIPREAPRFDRYYFVEALGNPGEVNAVYVEGFYAVAE